MQGTAGGHDGGRDQRDTVKKKARENTARALRAVRGQVPTPGVSTPLGTYLPRFGPSLALLAWFLACLLCLG